MSTPVEIAVAVVQRVVERDGSERGGSDRGNGHHGGEFLIGLRPADAPLAGYWEFPGGKVQVGEAAEAAAARECLEETGLAVRVVGEYPAVEHSYPHGDLRLRFFACELAVGAALSKDSRFRWVSRGELASYEFPPANRELLTVLQDSSC